MEWDSKVAISYSQAFRMRCICSLDDIFNKRTTELKEHLTCRGYDESTVQQQIERAKLFRQKDKLTPQTEKTTNKRTPPVGIIPSQPPTSDNPDTKEVANSSCLLPTPTSHTRASQSWLITDQRTLGTSCLVSVELKSPDNNQAKGSSPCGQLQCRTCQHILTEDTFTSTTTGHSFHV